eukprot:10000176-Ditylum_brightwellii.AAC.1
MLATTKEDTSLADGQSDSSTIYYKTKLHATSAIITVKEGKVAKLMNIQEHIAHRGRQHC